MEVLGFRVSGFGVEGIGVLSFGHGVLRYGSRSFACWFQVWKTICSRAIHGIISCYYHHHHHHHHFEEASSGGCCLPASGALLCCFLVRGFSIVESCGCHRLGL